MADMREDSQNVGHPAPKSQCTSATCKSGFGLPLRVIWILVQPSGKKSFPDPDSCGRRCCFQRESASDFGNGTTGE